jgi:antirestriction protein
MDLDQSINARLNAATAPASGSSVAGFFYIDGIPTKGVWVDLLPVRSWDDVREALEVAYPNAVVDEILMADYEGSILKPFYSSSCDAFSMTEWAEFAEDLGRTNLDMDVIEAYCSNFSYASDCEISKIEEAYWGEHDSPKDFAENYAEESGMFFDVPQTVRYYFDFQAFCDCELRHEFWEADGHYFRNL